jgi:hypothetical protein
MAAAVSVAGVVPAAGQTAGFGSRRLVASIGFAKMDPIHGDDDPEGPVTLGSLGIRTGHHAWVEFEVTRRSFSKESIGENVIIPIIVTPVAGTVGHADRQVFSQGTTDWTTSVNLVARGNGRIAPVGGGGLVIGRELFRQSLTFTNCVPPSVDPQHLSCRDFSRRETSVNVGFQGFGGVEIAVTPRVQGFATVRYEGRRDLGMGTFGVTGGVRVTLR